MNQFRTIRSRCVAIPSDNIDTDQIIPARFLKTVDRASLGAALFADCSYHSDGNANPSFVLNQPWARGAEVLVAGHNFGCGSSREHAVWALLSAGFRVVVSTQFADIFQSNALKNGLLTVQLGAEPWRTLLARISADDALEVTVDLAEQTLDIPGVLTASFDVDRFARQCLMEGVDEIGFLLARQDLISRYELSHPQRAATL
jgi:3-isopropylmalate/(R)-2-methylmalate dehydratase small subunit